jgi:glycosyltransferase involved in cell wall biosynthesis
LFEAWPTVILEAFEARTPVFAYDCPSGPREMLGDGSRGMITEERPEAIAEAVIAYFAGSHDSRDRMAIAALTFLEDFRPKVALVRWERELLAFAAANRWRQRKFTGRH